MARPQKKVIDIQPERKPKPPVMLDDIFFHKTQLDFGTRLKCYGRLKLPSVWEVVGIESHFLGKYVGETQLKKVNQIRHLSDLISLRNLETGEVMKFSFAYISYSAIWRIA